MKTILFVLAVLLALTVAAPQQETEPREGRAAFRIDPAYFIGKQTLEAIVHC